MKSSLFRFLGFTLLCLFLLSCSGSDLATPSPSTQILPATSTISDSANTNTNTEIAPTQQCPPTETVTVAPPVATSDSIPPSLQDYPDPAKTLHIRSLIATRAAELAAQTMPGAYSWEEYRTCSTYISAFLSQLSFPVADTEGKYADYQDPFPLSGTIDQTDWMRRNYPEFVYDAPVSDFLSGKLWDKIMPGSVIYMQTNIGHNGYNTYYHTVVLVRYDEYGSPIFAEIAGGMPGVRTARTFAEMTTFYHLKGDGSWDIEPYPTPPNTPDHLIVTWFDPFAILHKGQLWQRPGPVVPNNRFLFANFDQAVTVNIFDGTTAVFKSNGNTWEPVTISGHNHFYSGLGRLLPANSKITPAFLDTNPQEIYDGDFGVYLSRYGVYQHTWTPQMLARLTGFEYINGFGGLDGGTDTSLLIPQIYSQTGLQDNWDYSSFTIHRIPDVTNQDILLRADLLTAANDLEGPYFGPISVPQVYLSSGCVNLDANTWQILKEYLQAELRSGQRIAVIFSYPHFNQDLLPTIDIFTSAFTGAPFNKWCFDNPNCDPFDRRDFRQTYLDQ